MAWGSLLVLLLLVLTARLVRLPRWWLVYGLLAYSCALQISAWEDRQDYYANWQRDWTDDSARWARDLTSQVQGTQQNCQAVSDTLTTLCTQMPKGWCTKEEPK